MNMLSLSKFPYRDVILVLVSVVIYGATWGTIYLFLSVIHGMVDMFNDDFIWMIAKVFDVQLNTISKGFLFAFLDGSIFGFLFGILLLKVYRRNDDKR